MALTQHNSPLSVTYAKALLELANDRKIAEDIGRELQGLGQILEAEPVFKEYLADPGISSAERGAALERIFHGRISELVFSILGVMNSHGRLRIIDQVVSA